MAASADLGAAPPQAAADSNARADANLLGLLGLELLLLVFFILLAAAAKPDPVRALPVMQSMRESFRPAIASWGDPALSGGDSLGEPRLLLERAAQKLQSALPLGAISTWSDGRRLYVDLPIGGFFSEAGDRLTPLGRERLLHIAALVAAASEGQGYALLVALAPAIADAPARLAAVAALLGQAPLAGPLSAVFDQSVPADRVRFQLALGAASAGGAP